MRPTIYSNKWSRVLRIISLLVFFLLLVTPVVIIEGYVQAYAPHQSSQTTPSRVPDDIALDTRLPVQSVAQQRSFTNMNATFGSRFNFSVNPATASVESGTDGIFHENAASYVVGIAPQDEHQTLLFHMGHLNKQQGDSYLANETWTQGLGTTRWQGDALNEDMHVIVNIISPFQGEPACIVIASCSRAVADDTLPLLIIGVRLQNMSAISHTGSFLFGSNRATATPNACIQEQTNARTPVTLFSYASTADTTGGTLFLAGKQDTWTCQTALPDRAGLAWNYTIPAGQSRTAYMLIGGWNPSQNLFVNTQLPAGCQSEALYATHEWPSEQAVVNFALDNLSSGDNLLGQAQQMENQLITNNILSPEQRWLLGETLRSYKANSWLLAHPCANDGNAAPYDAAVYEGTYGLLSTVDVMHDYGYFEITHVPWFFRAEMTTVLHNATTNTNGTYFQHDQGGDATPDGACTAPGTGTPTIRATCYAPPFITSGIPMPTEENADVALLLTYYTVTTGDHTLAAQHLDLLNAAMQHNLLVGNPQTGIAYAGQDTATTYDAASDCLHNVGVNAGNQYYLGLKEAAAYRATAYLDNIVSQNTNSTGNSYSTIWSSAATKIENAMVQEYNTNGYIPLADNIAFSNCSGRSITLGEGLFYLHLSGLDRTMNQTLLSDLSSQYLTDLAQSTIASSTLPGIVTMTSTAATGSQCKTGHCRRYEWFSKTVLSSLVADIVYTKYGCMNCARLDLSQAAYAHNINLKSNFSDGVRTGIADISDWDGHLYPRGIICWAYLSSQY